MATNQDADVIITARIELLKTKEALNTVRKDMAKLSKNVAPDLKKIATAEQEVFSASQKLNKLLKPQQFQMWALSIMFMGQAMTNAFNSMWRVSSKTFQDVMHSVEGTVTGFDLLNGSVTYLQFSVGQALEPFAQALVPIIDSLSEWINQNPELFRTLTAIFATLGTAMSVGGSFTLFKDGVDGLVGAFKAIEKSQAISGIIKAVTAPEVALFLAAVAAIGALSWKAFNETPEAWKAMTSAFEKIDLTSIYDNLNEISKIILGMPLDWESIAWAISYVGYIASINLMPVVDTINLIVTAVKNAVLSLSSLAKAFKGDWKGAWADFKAGNIDSIKEQYNNLKTLWGSINTSPLSFEQYKTQNSLVSTPMTSIQPQSGVSQPQFITYINGMDQKTAQDIANMVCKQQKTSFERYIAG
jgi:hypothetical protein